MWYIGLVNQFLLLARRTSEHKAAGSNTLDNSLHDLALLWHATEVLRHDSCESRWYSEFPR